MTEIQGKSILVRVSARFELARVRVIGSRLYLLILEMVILLKIKRRDFFFNETLTRRFKMLYFRNETDETRYVNGNLYKDLLFIYLYNLMTSLRKPCPIFRSLNQLHYACCGGVASAHGSHS